MTDDPFTQTTPDVPAEDPLAIQVGSGEFELHEAWTPYASTLDRIEPDTGQYGDTLKWIFIEDRNRGKGENGADRETFAWTSRKITPHPKNKAGQFWKGLTGKDVAKGEAVNLRALFGSRANLIFEVDTEAGKDRVFAIQRIGD